MFAEIQRIIGGVSPDEIMFDFEKSAMDTAEAIFLGIVVKGCFYHLTGNVWKKNTILRYASGI